jgi:hypothetical protein
VRRRTSRTRRSSEGTATRTSRRQERLSSGTFAPRWNCGALCFGALWYFYRGLWVNGAVLILLVLFTAGVALPFAWIYAGLACDYDYYVLCRKHTQLWA